METNNDLPLCQFRSFRRQTDSSKLYKRENTRNQCSVFLFFVSQITHQRRYRSMRSCLQEEVYKKLVSYGKKRFLLSFWYILKLKFFSCITFYNKNSFSYKERHIKTNSTWSNLPNYPSIKISLENTEIPSRK